MQTSVPCTSRKPKCDKLLKSLGVVCKTSPRESLNASGFFDWWFRMTWKLLTGTSLIECLIWLPGTQGDTKCDIWMRDFLLVINFMQSRLQTFSSSSLIHSILHFFLLQDFLAFPAVAFFTVFCEHWGVSQIPPNQKLALRIVRYDISTHMEAVCFVWFLLWLCKSVLLNTLPHRIQCFKILISFAFLVQKDLIYPNYVSNT